MKLSDQLVEHFRLLETQKKALKRLRIDTVEDLLYHFPSRYENTADIKQVSSLKKDDSVILYGKLSGLKTKKSFRSRIPISEAQFQDSTGSIKIIWFHQPYIAKMFKGTVLVKITGKVSGDKNSIFLANPEIDRVNEIPEGIHGSLFTSTHTKNKHKENSFYPFYPESKGITSKWFFHAIRKIFESGLMNTISDSDPVPEEILKKYNLPTLKSALVWIHTPKTKKDNVSARKRFAFNEVFYIQLLKQQDRHENNEKHSLKVSVDEEKIREFMDRFPFEATHAQKKAISDIVSDFKKDRPMSRLLEGDVGSGKTAVAASTIYSVTTSRPPKSSGNGFQDFGALQTAYMVPTEILAKQHFESFIKLFAHLPINIALITSSGCRKFPSKVNKEESTNISKPQLLKWVKGGEISIVIGTHSLIQKSIEFQNLAYVIIDEQHRFGTLQRQRLARKDEFVPHFLSMTATPIPRTLALTIYGDLDLTLLDQMPHGRKPIITEIVLPTERNKTYGHIRAELEVGRQVYVICPRIDEPDPKKAMALNVVSVIAEAKRLKSDIFSEYEIDILHSKMTPKDKGDAMERFEKGDTDILVATSVVEVGVNVPNATMIIIEGAERFGLAQLHQLRGRVIRSNHQAYCFIFSSKDTKQQSKQTTERLKAIKTAKNGFELAEFDLTLRGSGELYGKKQWGLTDLGMEAIKNVKMVEAARNEAESLIKKDPDLKKYTKLANVVKHKQDMLHFE